MTTHYKCLIAVKLEPLAAQSEKENFTVSLVNNALQGNFLSQQLKYVLFEP